MRTYRTPILNTCRLETSPFCASEEYQDSRISGFSDIGILGYRDSQISGFSDIGILGYRARFTGIRGAREKNLASKIPGRAKKREGLVSSLEYMLLCMKRECAEKHFKNVKTPARASSFAHYINFV